VRAAQRVRSGEEFRELGHLGWSVDHRLDQEFVDAGLFQEGDAGEEAAQTPTRARAFISESTTKTRSA
jgi:hypothetical protein